jgi:serine phosphatase RsbU (regulator of sigma subunit)
MGHHMNSGGKRSQLWVKLAIGAGILLGLALLVETITTYFFVYDKLIREEAYREAERQQTAIGRLAARDGIKDNRKLSPVLTELQRNSPRHVAWIRIVDVDANILAESGTPLTAPLTARQLHRQLDVREALTREHTAQSGRIFISLVRFRLSGPPRPPLPPDGFTPKQFIPNQLTPGAPRFPGRDAPTFAEIAIYQEGISIPFGALRQNLIIGCLAALALLASMVLIGILFTRFLRARQLEQQVELARTVQTGLLPSPQTLLPSSASVDYGAVFVPAATIGGDFYDVFTAENGQTSLVLGDVAGKGISAAILMGVLHGAIRSMDWTRSASDHEKATARLNRLLCEKTARERFASLFWAYFTPETGLLHYINAGHLPPLLIRASETERLDGGGPVLGLLPHAQYRSGKTRVEAGDLLIIFSDGIAEAMNASEEEFGEERIAQIVRRNMDQHPRLICDAIVKGIGSFLGAAKPHDDQTLLIVRLTPVGTANATALASDGERIPV